MLSFNNMHMYKYIKLPKIKIYCNGNNFEVSAND
jgi:hypothetical protein